MQNLGPMSGEAGGASAGAGEEAGLGFPIASQSVGVMRSTPRSGFDEWKAGEVFGDTAGFGRGGGEGTGGGSEITVGAPGSGPGSGAVSSGEAGFVSS